MRYAIAGVFGLCALLLLWLYWPLEGGMSPPGDINGGAPPHIPGAAMEAMGPAAQPFPAPDEAGALSDADRHALHGRLTSQDPRLELAGIHLQLTSAAGYAMHSPEVTTDLEGRFTFEDLPPASYVVLLREPGLAFAEGVNALAHVSSQAAPEALVLEIVQGGSITGRVYDAATHGPITGGYVAAIPLGPDTRATLHPMPTPQLSETTDPDGAYRIDHLSPGTYQVFHIAPEQEQDSPYRLAMQQAQRYYTSHMQLGMPMLPGQERARRPRVEAEVYLGETTTGVDLPLHVPTLTHMAGLLVDQNGQPIPDVEVRISRASLDLSVDPINRTLHSDAEGRFRFDGLPAGDSYLISTAYVTGSHRGMQQSERIEALPVAGYDDVLFELMRYGAIRGRVLDANGAPYPLELGLQNLEREDGFYSFHAQCNTAGNFTMDYIPAGYYRIDALIGGEAIQELATIDVASGEEVEDLTLIFDPTGTNTIKGVVLDESGAPISRVRVMATRQDSDGDLLHVRGNTDDAGQFELLLHAAGRYRLRFNHSEHLNKALENIPAGADNLEVVLGSGFTLRGRVVDARNNQPIELFGLSASSLGEASAAPPGMTPEEYRAQFAAAGPGGAITSPIRYYEDGVFELSGMGSSVHIFIWSNDYLSHHQLIEGLSPASARREITIRLRSAPHCEGKVVDRRGRPVPFAKVHFGQQGQIGLLTGHVQGLQRSVTTNELGHFSIRRLTSGPDDALVATHPDYLPAILGIPESQSDIRGLELVLTRGARIEGRITHNGHPVAGAHVHLQLEDPYYAGFDTVTAQHGRYVLDKLPEGDGLLRLAWDSADDQDPVQIEVTLLAEYTTTVDYDLGQE